MQLVIFLNVARTKPWFNHTIFIIVADHTAQSAGKIALDPNKHHIPLLIYAPNILKPQKIDHFGSQVDIAPTILGILNFDYQTKFYGVDMMRTNPNRTFISNYRELGYIEDNQLVILKPNKKATLFKRNHNHDFIELNEEKNDIKDIKMNDTSINILPQNPDLLKTAISYFQTASEWYLNKIIN